MPTSNSEGDNAQLLHSGVTEPEKETRKAKREWKECSIGIIIQLPWNQYKNLDLEFKFYYIQHFFVLTFDRT